MTNHLRQARKKRAFLPASLSIDNWQSIAPYFEILINTEIASTTDLEVWLKKRSELEAVLEEEMAWRYIKMNCYTNDKQLADRFNVFVSEVEPRVNEAFNTLDKKLAENEFFNTLDNETYYVFKRALKQRLQLFRSENIPLMAELQVEEQKYSAIAAAMTIEQNGETLTLQQAANLLKETNRDTRKEAFEKINARRQHDHQALDTLLSRLINKRHQVALNAGYNNYRDYKYAELGRFDYGVAEVQQFCASIQKTVMPVMAEIDRDRKNKLAVEVLKPYDLDVDADNLPALKPFATPNALIDGTITCFNRIHPHFGEYIRTMQREGYLDLDSRVGKAPGGFNYPLYESNIPFIFMNATSNLRDLVTMVHEGGHAIHSFVSAHQPLVAFKNLPSEVAEMASMSMELISMEHWDVFFNDNNDVRRAKVNHLESVLQVFPWIATIDQFQDWLYTNPGHTHQQRREKWNELRSRFTSGEVSWEGYENYNDYLWQKQLHIFEVPFYYIEYGIAQLAAIAMWKQYKHNGAEAIANYLNALSLGYAKTIPEIYKHAGIPFDFSQESIHENIQFIKLELDKLK